MSAFAGFVQLGNTIDVVVIAKNPTTNVPVDADTFPTFRIYGPAGFLASGALTFKDVGVVTGATNANPVVFTSVGHGLSVGQRITTTGITPSGFNLTGNITAVTTNTFTLAVDSTGFGAFTVAGAFHGVGIYDFDYTVLIGNNFASGSIYSVFVIGLFSTVSEWIDNFTFEVT